MEEIEINGEKIEVCERNRFSKFVQKENLSVLESWRQWFDGRGINAGIARVRGQGYALYRNGLTAGEDE